MDSGALRLAAPFCSGETLAMAVPKLRWIHAWVYPGAQSHMSSSAATFVNALPSDDRESLECYTAKRSLRGHSEVEQR